VWFARSTLLSFLGSQLVYDQLPRKAQAILVLDGDDFGTRIIKGAQLAAAGYAPFVMVSNHPSLSGCTCQETIAFAERRGYPASLFQTVTHPPQITSTRAEAVYLGSCLKKRGLCDIVIVTSNYHTRRAAYLFHRQLPWLRFSMVAAPDPFFSPNSWWKQRDGQKTFLLESVKTFASHVGY
jgi:uncharacterized SAM-binding protein YcdF (DUF218 family)